MQPITNPPVPYVGPIQGGFNPGTMIRIQGQVPPAGDRFNINLHCGEPPSNIAMHLSVRLLQNYVARNSLEDGEWGKEEDSGQLPIAPGQRFEVLILCDPDSYKVAVNGNHFCEFQHRISFRKVNHVAVDGDVTLGLISVEGAASAPPPQGPPAYAGEPDFGCRPPPGQYGGPPPGQYGPPPSRGYGGPPPGYGDGPPRPGPMSTPPSFFNHRIGTPMPMPSSVPLPPSSAPQYPSASPMPVPTPYAPQIPSYPPASYIPPSVPPGRPAYPTQPSYQIGGGGTYPTQPSYPIGGGAAYPTQPSYPVVGGATYPMQPMNTQYGSQPITYAPKQMKKSKLKKAMKYGLPIAGAGLGAYAISRAIHGSSSSSSSDSD